MEIVFLDKKDLKIMPFKIDKKLTDKNWSHLKNEAIKKLGTNIAIIFWDNKKIFSFTEVTYEVVKSELGIKTQF